VLSKEERALPGALLLLAARRERVAALQAELASQTHILERFAAECQLRLASLFAELDHLRHAIAACERRIARLRSEARSAPSPDPDPEPEFDDEADWESGADARHFRRRSGDDRPPTEEDAETAAELKRLYLELARRHHPDLAADAVDRERRQELMLRVNAAFRERDLDALRALADEAEAADAPPTRSPAERLAWTRREIYRLEGLIADLCGELHELRFGETGRLWQRHQAGEPILDHLADQLRRETASQRLRLGDLTALQDRLARVAKSARRKAAQTA
jgi:hypothetical protein